MHDSAGISSRFRAAFLNSPDQLGFSLTVLLAWIAVCDSEVAESERRFIAEIAGKAPRSIDSAVAIEAAQCATPEDLQLACEVVRHIAIEKRRLVMDMAIGVAMVDGRLRPMENHVLRFLADMLELGEAGLEASFLEATGSSGGQERPHAPKGSDAQRVRALATLGLEDSASAQEIVQAYRRLARVHHPDRFETLGVEAVRAATQTFQRIQAAYEYLRKLMAISPTAS